MNKNMLENGKESLVEDNPEKTTAQLKKDFIMTETRVQKATSIFKILNLDRIAARLKNLIHKNGN